MQKHQPDSRGCSDMKVIMCPTHDFTYIFLRITVMHRRQETESYQSHDLPVHTNVKVTHVDSSKVGKEESATFPASVYQGLVTMEQPFCTRMIKHEFCLLLPICRLVCVTIQHTHAMDKIFSAPSCRRRACRAAQEPPSWYDVQDGPCSGLEGSRAFLASLPIPSPTRKKSELNTQLVLAQTGG